LDISAEDDVKGLVGECVVGLGCGGCTGVVGVGGIGGIGHGVSPSTSVACAGRSKPYAPSARTNHRDTTVFRRLLLDHNAAMPVDISVDSRVVVSSDTVTENLDVGGVAVNLHNLRPTSFDRVGMAMWKALSAAPTIEGAVQVLMKEFAVEREVLERDLIAFVGQLAELDLVTVADGAALPASRRASQAAYVTVDAHAVMGQRHRDWIDALITNTRESGVLGDVTTIDSADQIDSGDNPIAVLHVSAGCPPLAREEFSDLCRRVPPGGVVIVDDYNLPPWQQVVDAVRSDRQLTSPLEPMDWSSVWWRM